MAGNRNVFNPRSYRFSEALTLTWEAVYPISGFDPNEPALKQVSLFGSRLDDEGNRFSPSEDEEDYNLHQMIKPKALMGMPRIRFLTFIGLPVRTRQHTPAYDRSAQGYRKLLLNFIGWPDIPFSAMSTFRKGLAFATAVVALPWHLITMPLKFLQNIAKFVVEFLPRLASEYCMIASRKDYKKDYGPRAGAIISGLLAGLGYAAYAAYFIGRAVVSPIQGIRFSYSQNAIRRTASNLQSLLPRPARIALSILSGAITVTAYALLFPIVLPLIVAKVPFIAEGVAAIAQTKAGVFIGKALSTVGEFVKPVIGTALEALGIAAAPSVIVGGASLLGIGAATVAPMVDKLIDEAADKIDSSTKKVFREVKRENVPQVSQDYVRSSESIDETISSKTKIAVEEFKDVSHFNPKSTTSRPPFRK